MLYHHPHRLSKTKTIKPNHPALFLQINIHRGPRDHEDGFRHTLGRKPEDNSGETNYEQSDSSKKHEGYR